MEDFEREIVNFFSDLGLAKKKVQEFLESGSKDYRKFLGKKGARRIDYQKDMRSHIRHRGLLLIEENVIVVSMTPDGERLAIVQLGDNNTFPSEETAEWLYFGKVAMEPPTLSAYHLFFEIAGGNVNYDFTVESLREKMKTYVEENRDIIYRLSKYYKVQVPYEEFLKIGKKWKIISLSENEINELMM